MKRIAAFLFASMLTQPALAEPDPFPEAESETGSRFMRPPENAPRDEARELQKRVVRCAVYGDRELARSILINSDPVSIDFAALGIESDELTDELEISRCISRAMKHTTYKMQMRFQYSTLRALIAEEVYLLDNDDAPIVEQGADPFDRTRSINQRLNPRVEGMARLADCIVHHDTEASDALLRSTIASNDEHEAVEALYPSLARCGLKGDGKSELDYSMLRRIVADGLWTYSHARSVSAGSGRGASE